MSAHVLAIEQAGASTDAGDASEATATKRDRPHLDSDAAL